MQEIKVSKLVNCYSLPTKATLGSAGFDLYAAITSDIVIESDKFFLIPLGFKMSLPNDYEAQIRPRSGLALKHGVTVLNSPGTIDSDYTGEICVILINHGNKDFIVSRGLRIAQMVIQKVLNSSLKEVDHILEDESNSRKSGGFGSTGY